ncbi:MAG TPA: heparan-alpha-glucosaminide N-acetyltransferase domain-containing protein [Nevskia sp.]|nr:heparan-alpha-glucosaminide N-acetyltransferase domain-containing protein [Nevskia sp.]
MTGPGAPETKARLPALDALRGIVVVLMALDHCRDYFSAYPYPPTDLDQASVALFLTRWITHFCAPVFVLLAGTSAWLHAANGGLDRRALQRFLVTRGLWIVFLEVTWNSVMWRFDLHGIQLQVLWALGMSMLFLALLLWLPRAAIIAIGTAIVIGHHGLDGLHASDFGAEDSPAALGYSLLHEFHFIRSANGFEFGIIYPLLPWIGVMALGYGLGPVFAQPAAVRDRRLLQLGLAALLLFALLRLANGYGDPQHWAVNARGAVFTALGWLNASKYPPSLIYLTMTLGPALLLLSRLDHWRGRLATIVTTFGRVPMFFYLLHVPLIHLGSLAARYILFGPAAFRGERPDDLPASYEPSLLPVYGAWFIVLVLLYPLCRWFGDYKRRHRDQTWLSYL